MKTIKKSHYTILITSDNAKRLYRLRVTDMALIAMSLFIVGILCMIGVISLKFINVRYEVAEYLTLKKENRLLEDHMHEFESTAEKINVQIENMSRLESGILADAGIETERNVPFGIGGFSEEDRGRAKELHGQRNNLTEEVRLELDRLHKESMLREMSLNELTIYLEGEQDYINSTPSIWPTRGFVTSGFGYRRDPFTRCIKMHEGIDIANKVGTLVYTGADGLIVFAGIESGYGMLITIEHGYGMATRYGHLDTILVHEGDRVKKGDKIGTIGCSGRCTGSHLHYEVRINSVPVNPQSYIVN